MTKTIEQIAAEMNVNVISLKSFLSFFQDNAQRDPSIIEWLQSDPDACLKAAMEAWLKASKKYMDKLLDKNSEEYKKLASEVYYELRARQGL